MDIVHVVQCMRVHMYNLYMCMCLVCKYACATRAHCVPYVLESPEYVRHRSCPPPPPPPGPPRAATVTAAATTGGEPSLFLLPTLCTGDAPNQGATSW